ncbi:MAG: arylsulfatase [Clostridia bacterium]|nr:arylsulfatase [Clostridia bacterium]
MPYNVLLLMTDQHRFDCLGCYGNDSIDTPNLDYLASLGTVFDSAYTPVPSCVPARACLVSGMNQWNAGILGMGKGQGHMGINFPQTLPGELARNGYHTQAVGKNHFFPIRALNGYHNTVLEEGGAKHTPWFVSDYQKWLNEKTGNMSHYITTHGIDPNSWAARPFNMPEDLHPTNWTVEKSLEFLRDKDPTAPFFLKTSFVRPHSPYDPPEYFFNKYMNRQLPEPHIGDWAGVHDVPLDAKSPVAWHGRIKPSAIKEARAGYYGSVDHIDNQIGRIISYLRKNRQLDNTMIIFTSDHGDMLGDHHMWRKTYAYEGSAKIPMIVVLPKDLREGVVPRSDSPVTLQDIMPTVLEILGFDIPERVDGISMRQALYGDNSASREFIHGEHCWCYSHLQECQYITDGKTKYVYLPGSDEEQFFDLEKDPGELHNAVNDSEYSDILDKWRGELVKILDSRGDGYTKDGRPVSWTEKGPMVSPEYQKRLDSSPVNWNNYHSKIQGIIF